VDLSHKEYNLRVTDLSVKVPGGFLEITRRYEADRWVFDHNRFRLFPKCLDFPHCTTLLGIVLNGAEYEQIGWDEVLFVRETSQITRDNQGRYTWKDKAGNWMVLRGDRQLEAFGNRGGLLGRYLYSTGGSHRVMGVEDRNGRQVYWFEYDEGEGRPTAVRDLAGRRVEYGYLKGLLRSVRDVS